MLSIVRSPYLLGVCVFLVLGKFCATVVYLHLLDAVGAQITIVERRTELFAWENAAVQILTLAFQLFLASFLMRRVGLPLTLALVPLCLTVGFAGIVAQPSLAVLFTVQVLQRSGAYGLLNPAREVLFTVVGREDKYKAKSFIDTAIFRGGDAASASIRTILVQQMGATGMALIAVPCAAVWAVVGYVLGKQQQRQASQTT
jgi:AAA family ATP:ADP antiporter